jgi:hypothetical protein
MVIKIKVIRKNLYIKTLFDEMLLMTFTQYKGCGEFITFYNESGSMLTFYKNDVEFID